MRRRHRVDVNALPVTIDPTIPIVGSKVRKPPVTLDHSSPAWAAAHCTKTPTTSAAIPVARNATIVRHVPMMRSATASTVRARTTDTTSCQTSLGTKSAVTTVHQLAWSTVVDALTPHTTVPMESAEWNIDPVTTEAMTTMTARAMLAGAART